MRVAALDGDDPQPIDSGPVLAITEPVVWWPGRTLIGADGPPEFAGTFHVDKANLTHVGRNPYFIPLEPGYRLRLEGGGATLTALG